MKNIHPTRKNNCYNIIIVVFSLSLYIPSVCTHAQPTASDEPLIIQKMNIKDVSESDQNGRNQFPSKRSNLPVEIFIDISEPDTEPFKPVNIPSENTTETNLISAANTKINNDRVQMDSIKIEETEKAEAIAQNNPIPEKPMTKEEKRIAKAAELKITKLREAELIRHQKAMDSLTSRIEQELLDQSAGEIEKKIEPKKPEKPKHNRKNKRENEILSILTQQKTKANALVVYFEKLFLIRGDQVKMKNQIEEHYNNSLKLFQANQLEKSTAEWEKVLELTQTAGLHTYLIELQNNPK